jgi:hypothetical protein
MPFLQPGSSLKTPSGCFINARPYCRAVRVSNNLSCLLKVFRTTVQIARHFDLIGGKLIAGDNQISISDPDSRQIMLRNNTTEVCYNVQTTVDAKHNIPVDFMETSQNFSKAMGNMVQRVKSILRTNDFKALFDKCYISILEKDQLMKQLRILVLLYLTVLVFLRGGISRLKTSVFQKTICPWQIQLSLKSL